MTRRAAALALLTVALLMSACAGLTVPASGDPSSSASASGTPHASATAPALTVDRVIETLAEGGIAVYDDADDLEPIRSPADPVSRATLLRFQVEQVVRDANAGGGVSATEIDDLLPMPADAVPFSMILAGYVATAQTPGAHLAAELMAGQDLEATETLWFPTIVLLSFVGEAAGAIEAASASATGPAATGPPPVLDGIDARLAAADPCGDFSRFLAGTIASIKDAILSVIPSIPFLKAAIEWALTKGIDMAADAARELIGRIPFLTAIADGVKALALAATVVATLRDVPVPVVSDPQRAHYSVGSTVNSVTLTATVGDDVRDEIPEAVRNCASLLGIDLPKSSGRGTPVEWRILDGAYHTAPGITLDDVIGTDLRARYMFTTRDEPQRNHDSGAIVNAAIRVQVTVRRQDVAQVKAMIDGLITSAIPEVVWTELVDRFGDPIAKLTDWANPRAVGLTVAEFHGEPEPTPSPSASASAPPSSPPPSPSNQKDEFCRRYRALIAWGRNPTEKELSQAWARYIDAAAQDLLTVAPPEMVLHVEIMIEAYGTYGYAEEPLNVPLTGPSAARLGEAAIAMHRYCGLPLQ